MEEKEETVLALKEVNRQFEKMRRMYGDEVMGDALSTQGFTECFADLLAGRITATEDAQQRLDSFEEVLAQEMRATNDPMMVTGLDAENEAKAKQLPVAARMLIWDAVRSAAGGVTKEQWIAEVLSGHASDETAQLGCLRHIVTLWSDGPWAWPRESRIEPCEGSQK